VAAEITIIDLEFLVEVAVADFTLTPPAQEHLLVIMVQAQQVKEIQEPIV
jgi:hypothetical protein